MRYLMLVLISVFILVGCEASKTAGNSQLKITSKIYKDEKVMEDIEIDVGLGANIEKGGKIRVELNRDSLNNPTILVKGDGKGDVNRDTGHKTTEKIYENAGDDINQALKNGSSAMGGGIVP